MHCLAKVILSLSSSLFAPFLAETLLQKYKAELFKKPLWEILPVLKNGKRSAKEGENRPAFIVESGEKVHLRAEREQ